VVYLNLNLLQNIFIYILFLIKSTCLPTATVRREEDAKSNSYRDSFTKILTNREVKESIQALNAPFITEINININKLKPFKTK